MKTRGYQISSFFRINSVSKTQLHTSGYDTIRTKPKHMYKYIDKGNNKQCEFKKIAVNDRACRKSRCENTVPEHMHLLLFCVICLQPPAVDYTLTLMLLAMLLLS